MFSTFAIVDPTHQKLEKNLDPAQPNPWINPTRGQPWLRHWQFKHELIYRCRWTHLRRIRPDKCSWSRPRSSGSPQARCNLRCLSRTRRCLQWSTAVALTSRRTPISRGRHANSTMWTETRYGPQNLVAAAKFLERPKTDFRSFIYNHSSTNPVHLVTISLVDFEITGRTAIAKNKIKREHEDFLRTPSAAV